ncbi:MAG: hypothetical protein ACFFB3_01635 [Candidatus Hodarchaeota archaeon]
MSPSSNSRAAPKTYARIYCTPEERDLWTQIARNLNYESFTHFARAAIQLLSANPHLQEILRGTQGKDSDENLAQIMQILAQIEEQAKVS